jgi:phage terminase small subunit
MSKPKAKAGSANASAAARRLIFAKAYIANGRNATQAAIAAGLSAKTAGSSGQRMLKNVATATLIAELAAPAAKIAGLSIERTLQEVARLAYADPRKMFRPDGSPIPVHEMDADVAATVASIEHETLVSADGDASIRTTKLKTWDKGAALDKAMRHLGLYERDNAQRGESLALQIVVVGPE